MRRRLLVVLVPLLGALFGAFGVTLAANIAQSQTQSVYLDRLADAERFAALADDALRRGRFDALQTELTRYDQLYGIAVAILTPDRRQLVASRSTWDSAAPGVSDGLGTALAGYRPDRIATVWPWRSTSMVVVEPVGRDTGVIAAVVLVSPTDRLRSAILRRWGELGALTVLPFALTVLLAALLARWVLRPVRDLDRATVAIAAGRLDARAVTVTGPPELRRLAGSFNTMIDIVVHTLRRQRTFAADASHQLRNPLASLRLAVDNLAGYVSDDGRELHAVALGEAEEMGRVVDALLALTAAEGAALASTPQPLAALVAERVPRWRQLVAAAGMQLTVEVAAGLASYAPADALGSILDELVGNASRLSGGTTVTVAATSSGPEAVATGHGPEVVVTVYDDGAGLTADERLQAGGRFWRGRAHEQIPGTGLGLAICREIVQAWGGRLTLDEVQPRGLAVRVVLPGADLPSTVHGQDLTERK